MMTSVAGYPNRRGNQLKRWSAWLRTLPAKVEKAGAGTKAELFAEFVELGLRKRPTGSR